MANAMMSKAEGFTNPAWLKVENLWKYGDSHNE